jgi:HSP20 family protein
MRVAPAGARESEFGDGSARWRDTTWQPRADVYQSEDAILVHVETPGLQLENVRLYHEPGRLIIEGVRERIACGEGCQCLQMEIEHGAFRRVLPLPLEVDENAIEARLEAGILEIVVPRRTTNVSAKRIDVK